MTERRLTLDKAQVAAMFRVDVRTVTTWQNLEKDPLPVAKVGGRGKPNEYDAADCADWWARRKMREVTPDGDGEVIDVRREQARLARSQAEQAALKVQQMRGELAPIAALEWALGRLGAQISAQLESIPARIKRVMPEVTATAIEAVKKEVAAAQNLAAECELRMDEYRDQGGD